MNAGQSQALLIDRLLCRLLKGESMAWAEFPTGLSQEQLLERITYHGIQAMVWTEIQQSDWPTAARERLHALSMASARWELGHSHAVGRVLERFARASIGHLLFKGTALAYSCYPNPVHRFRSDTDILVPMQDRDAAMAVLQEQGFNPGSPSEEQVYYQQTFRLTDACDAVHAIDLHWKFSNSELLAGLFNYGELLDRAETARVGGVLVNVPCKTDAVLIACLHTAVHDYVPYWINGKSYTGGARLIWLYDLHVLVSHFRLQDWDDLTEQAVARGLGEICVSVLEDVREKFGTVMFLEGLEAMLGDSKGRATSYLRSRPLRRMWMDIAACSSWQEKFLYTKRLFFPSEAYMRHKYANDTQWLALLYLRRSLEGLYRRLQADSH
jgi:hypothetical protein